VQVMHTRTWKSGAARIAGALLFALAAYVAITSVASLLGYSEPKPTLLGIAILVAAAVVMPWLAREKRRLSGTTGSAALPRCWRERFASSATKSQSNP
jgi:divalent metal cation (Fe/Co/Zn/Cd) transporter